MAVSQRRLCRQGAGCGRGASLPAFLPQKGKVRPVVLCSMQDKPGGSTGRGLAAAAHSGEGAGEPRVLRILLFSFH